MRYRLIALDLDGTLLDSRKGIAPRTREALSAARARGILTVIATGRTLHSTRYWSRQIGGGPAICCNGAVVLDQSGDLLVEKGISRAPLQRLLQLAREFGVLAECYTRQGILLDRPVEQVRAYWRWVRPHQSPVAALRSLVNVWRVNRIRPVPSLLKWAEEPGQAPVLKLMLIGEAGKLGAVARQAKVEMPGLEVTSSGPDNLEITAAGVSKGSGLQQLSARLQIPREAVVAVGDSANDLEMLKYAGLGVAMGNAAPDVKAAADRVTASCDEDGVAHIIEELLRQ